MSEDGHLVIVIRATLSDGTSDWTPFCDRLASESGGQLSELVERKVKDLTHAIEDFFRYPTDRQAGRAARPFDPVPAVFDQESGESSDSSVSDREVRQITRFSSIPLILIPRFRRTTRIISLQSAHHLNHLVANQSASITASFKVTRALQNLTFSGVSTRMGLNIHAPPDNSESTLRHAIRRLDKADGSLWLDAYS